jgi:hypothetical protein
MIVNYAFVRSITYDHNLQSQLRPALAVIVVLEYWGICYKTYSVRNLRTFEIN